MAIRLQLCSLYMKLRTLSIPEIILIAGTRVALGTGIGLLTSGRLSKDQRKAAGWALFAVGALSSVPLVIQVSGKLPASQEPLRSGSGVAA
jgi:hypothetical protein